MTPARASRKPSIGRSWYSFSVWDHSQATHRLSNKRRPKAAFGRCDQLQPGHPCATGRKRPRSANRSTVAAQGARRATQCFPVVVVAASGNDPAESTTALEAEIPAIWGRDEAFFREATIDRYRGQHETKRPRLLLKTGEVASPGGDGGVRRQLCQQ